MGLDLYAYPTFTSGFLIADPASGTNSGSGPNGQNSADALASWTYVTGANGKSYPIAAALEIQSTTGALVVPRMTTAQKTAMGTHDAVHVTNGVPGLTLTCNGMIIYDTDEDEFQLFQDNAWETIQIGGGFVDFEGPVPANNELTRFAGVLGTQIKAGTGILISDTADITLVNTIKVGTGTAAAPSYSFTAEPDTGIYNSAANTVDIATGGTRAVSIGNAANTVNYLQLIGSSTGNSVKVNTLGTDTNIDLEFVLKGAGQAVFPVGVTATPSITFTGRTDTGMWSSNGATIDFSTTGGHQVQISNTGTAVNQVQLTGSAAGNPITVAALGSDTNISILLAAKGIGGVVVPQGALATPGLRFLNDLTTGLWNSAPGSIDFSCAATQQFQIFSTPSSVNWITATGGIAAAGGQAAFPLFFAQGADTAIDIGFSAKGVGAGVAIRASSSGAAGAIKFWNGGNTHFTALEAANPTANVTFLLPIVDATANSNASSDNVALSTDTAGQLSFSSTLIRHARVALTATQMKAIYATPYKLLDAPGASLGIIISHISMNYVYNTTAFTIGAQTNLIFQYGNTIHGAGLGAASTIASTGFLDQTHNTLAITGADVIDGSATSSIVNTAVYLSAQGADLTGGGTSTVTLDIWYSVVPTF